MHLSSPITSLGSIAAKLAPTLKKLEITTVKDLLYHFPSRHIDLSSITLIGKLVPGTLATIQGTIASIEDVRSKWKRIFITHATIKDATGSISCVWFHQRFLTKVLKVNDTIIATGKVEFSKEGLQFTHPEYEKVLLGKQLLHGARIVPIYPLTARLTQKQLRFLMQTALKKVPIPEWLPKTVTLLYRLIDLKKALFNIHFPQNGTVLVEAEHRLKFDELFLLQLRNALARKELAQFQAPPITFHEQETRQYVASLPFQLTKSQKQTAWEILKDIGKNRPTNRLLEGDVGSGKTVVASIAIFNTILSGFQAAYMAPTEILAEQHYKTFCKLFEKYDVKVGLITSSGASTNHILSVIPDPDRESKNKQQKEKEFKSFGVSFSFLDSRFRGNDKRKYWNDEGKKNISKSNFLKLVAEGRINLIIGTHSLIQKNVQFGNLGLVVVDEQHRFGVSQRQALARGSTQTNTPTYAEKTPRPSAFIPHFLSMTATPIPRTLALTVYGDLDISVITEMPRDRKPILTKFIPHDKRLEMYRHVQEEIQQGRQAFVVCPLIDPSDVLGVKSAQEEVEKLKNVFPSLRITILHGRQNAKQKNSVMKSFLERQFDILVSTPVVEVGIDVPNATIMIVESAERFGLAQLHQLRGRVGRSEHQSTCYLLSDSESEMTTKRLQAVISSNNGMELAEKDLEIRGPGDVWGVKQSGYEDTLYIARLTDFPIIQEAKKAAQTLLAHDPTLAGAPSVKQKVEEMERKIHPE